VLTRNCRRGWRDTWQIAWVTCGNTTNASLNRVFTQTFPSALQLLADGETIVEITEVR